MKKVISIFVAVVVLLSSFLINSSAEENLPVEIKAKAALLMDASSGQVLLSKNKDEKLYPASVTKIMAMLLVAEAIDSGKISMSDTVTASSVAVSKGGSQIWLKEGEQMSVEELFKATAVYSANDACTALGEYVSGSEEAFIDAMNKRAYDLGMKNTHFDNCTGLDDTTDTHLTTAYDIALMARELMIHDFVKKYTTIWMDSLRNGETQLVNTNKLVRFYPGCTGLKTGTTSKAGCCLCATAEREGTSLIAVVLGSDNSNDRFDSAKAMLNYGFSNFETVVPQTDPKLITDVNVSMGEERSLTPQIVGKKGFLIPKGRAGDLVEKITLATSVEAPVESNQTLGKIEIILDSKTVGTLLLTAPHYVERLTLGEVFRRMLSVFTKN